LAYIL